MSNIRVIRASAGSGKTKSLIDFFLELLISESTDYFSHILAVTFTNKATEEMKGRIIYELNILASGKSSRHLEDLIRISGFKEDHIRSKASAILLNILHNYSWFSVETIDTFFQRIIKAFTRELGIPGNYNIEIETKQVLQYAIDSLIDSLSDNPLLLNWMIDFSENRILEGKSWDIKYELQNLGAEVFKEEFSSESNKIFEAISNTEKLNSFRGALYKKIKDVEDKLEKYGDSGIAIISENGLNDSDFYQKGRGIGSYFRKLKSKSIERPGAFMKKLLAGPDFWPSNDSVNKEQVIQLADKKLLPLVKELLAYLDENFENYNSSRVILRNLHSLGILSDLTEKIVQYRIQHNSFLLSDSSAFIYRIIDNNVSPFIYEKMGNRYNNFLIDEFQDTSKMQWKNFLPLIENSISQGYDCLLVGDVKQSIYRWRNSNWEILANKIHSDFSEEYIKIKNLKFNWRSCQNIVDFINTLFPKAIEVVEKNIEEKSDRFLESNTEMKSILSKIYEGLEQTVASQNEVQGSVKVKFFSKQELNHENTHLLDHFCEDIDHLLQMGNSPGDIAVLVRGKREGKLLADHLIQQNSKNRFSKKINVISDESLFLSASDSVNLLIAALRYLIQPDDDINRGKLLAGFEIQRKSTGQNQGNPDLKLYIGMSSKECIVNFLPDDFTENINSLLVLPLYELVERLASIFELDRLDTNIAYAHAFFDLVHDYSQSNPGDIEKFLEYWEEEGMNKSVPAADSQNAIRIMTIHKAKGLEFKTVLVPFCNWNLDQKANAILWTKPEHPFFNYLPLVPVNYSKILADTVFKELYYSEMLKSGIDNLNLLYVALTRAEENLIVYSIYNESKDNKGKVTGVGELLYYLLAGHTIVGYEHYYNEDRRTFELGKIEIHKPSDNQITQESFITGSRGKPSIDKLFFNPSGFEFLSEKFHDIEEKKKHGIVVHNILSEISTASDIKSAVNKSIYKGLISPEESSDLMDHLLETISESRISRWFDGSGRVLNEMDIIALNGNIRRPDRVVLYSDSTDVIDYKSGTEDQVNKHKKQVQDYKHLLQQMGYRNVNGYIWYISSNHIVNV